MDDFAITCTHGISIQDTCTS